MGIDSLLADHRSLTAERRRDAMRMRLIKAAISVFATHGRAGVVIADVIKVAGVSRGTFYNYYRTTEEILADACHELSEEVVISALEATEGTPDMVTQFAACLHHVLATADAYPVLAHFVGTLGLGPNAPQFQVDKLLSACLAEGHAAGEFDIIDPEASADTIAGATIYAISRAGRGPQYRCAVVSGLLRGVGIPVSRADALSHAIPPPVVLPPDALLSVAQSHADATRPATTCNNETRND